MKTSRVASFWCLCQKLSLSPLYFNKTLLHKSSEWSSLISGPDWICLLRRPGIPVSYHLATTFHSLRVCSGSDGDLDLIPGLGWSPGEGNGNLFQYSGLENPMDSGAWLQPMRSQRVRHDWAANTFTGWIIPLWGFQEWRVHRKSLNSEIHSQFHSFALPLSFSFPHNPGTRYSQVILWKSCSHSLSLQWGVHTQAGLPWNCLTPHTHVI